MSRWTHHPDPEVRHLAERAEHASRERDEAIASREALREVLTWCGDGNCIHATPEQRRGMHTNGGCRCKTRVWEALAATPADLAAQYRAEVRRAALVEAEEVAWKIHVQFLEAGRHGKANYRAQACEIVALRLRALADEGEKPR